MIQFYNCASAKDTTTIWPITYLEYNIRNNLLPTEVPVPERILVLGWDNIPQKAVIREEVRGTSVKKRIH